VNDRCRCLPDGTGSLTGPQWWHLFLALALLGLYPGLLGLYLLIGSFLVWDNSSRLGSFQGRPRVGSLADGKMRP
jgi:hypothetical protein